MRATARGSERVEKPVYHLSVSLAPGERLERPQLEQVADRRLRAQAVSVVQRLGWRAVSRLLPGPAFSALRVTVALAKAPARVIGRGMGRGIEL